LGPYFPPSTPAGFPDPNSRVKPSPNQVGNQSIDLYAKNGYPKMLGDAVEQGSVTGGATTGVTGGTLGGTSGVAGQSGSFGGGALGGSISGGGAFGTGGGGGGLTGGGLINRGISGGGFTGGLMPKGFGFGGTPDFTRTWAPLNGGPNK
jgi:hypothetical protein